MERTKENLQDSQLRLLAEETKRKSVLLQRADMIAKSHGYPELRGIDALVRYFADKYHWEPQVTRSLSADDLHILLSGVE